MHRFWRPRDRASWFLKIKPTRCTDFSTLFLEWNSTCFGQFLCPSLEVFHCTHGNGISHTVLQTACEQDQNGTALHPDPARKQSANLYDIYHCCLYSTAVLSCGLAKNGMVGKWHGHGMANVNQIRPHCVNQMGKTHSKHLAARHGRGTACCVWIGLKAHFCPPKKKSLFKTLDSPTAAQKQDVIKFS